MFEPINRKTAADRRSVPLDPDNVPTIAQGQILEIDAADGYAKLADAGAAVVVAPLWAWTKTTRLDVQIAKAVTVLEAPFVARVDTDGYDGSPVAKNALGVGTGATAGKLVVVTVSDVATLQSVVAYCTKGPDADGVIEFKAIR